MQLHYEVEGSGHPLIVLHGLLGSSENWRTHKRAFGQSYQVFALDLRNHGHSPHSELFNYDVMAEDLREFMDWRALPTAHLLGHSLGGKVVMHFATRQPERVGKLVVVDIGPKAYRGEHRRLLNALRSVDLAKIESRAEADAVLGREIQDLGMRRFVLKNLERDKANGLRWRMNLEAIYRNYDSINEAIKPEKIFAKPACFVRGEKSNYISDEDLTDIRSIFPQAQIATIGGAGHWVHADAPGEFQRVVMSFLAQT